MGDIYPGTRRVRGIWGIASGVRVQNHREYGFRATTAVAGQSDPGATQYGEHLVPGDMARDLPGLVAPEEGP